jgi:tryptophanyl-tRNA synthetase
MSKSENQMATLYLSDDDDLIRKKIMKAKSDSGPADPGAPMSEAVAGLFQLLRLVALEERIRFYEEQYQAGTIRYGDLKKELAEGMVNFIRPIRERAEGIQHDTSYLKGVMEQGAAKARKRAQETIKLAQAAIGLKYY